ncbi:arylamine N-acetyltransferase family protein [Actinomadura rudentiformis]|uniref:Arylamine N-acetyltransferase n=1 Tax=Actinomadura rudentiformis TaxID=359158 RepID=A0A6H9YLR4_9ACTN|nr:arylamine N-acetyltransferase [Actinomadura rudentiformis]KAB2348310.1 arylamine N-acetyltransferase [Actinomadura rudentiformis]
METAPMSDSGYGWDGGELDIDAYLSRIGFDGERAPTLETLRALQRGHTTSIPFENLEIMLGRPILLDLENLQDKLVRRQRGGYCYEHTILFAAALERLGFGVTALSARVTLGADEIRPATHAVLRVTTAGDDRVWLCDVGFGRGPLEPIEFADGAEAVQDGWRFRLERRTGALDTDLWVLHQYGGEGWVDRHTFTLNPQYSLDYAVGNHYVSTSPRSPFTTRPFAQRFGPEVHHVLDGTTWTTTRPDGSTQTREVEESEIPKLLDEVFGVTLDAADAARLGQPSLTAR